LRFEEGNLLGKLTRYTEDERQMIEPFRGVSPAVSEYMLQILKVILDDVDDEGIKGSYGRLLRVMRKETISFRK
jgi:hypothetical protein